MKPLRIFISSVQKEFAEERMALRDYLLGDALLRRFFECFLFEEVPAADRRADEVYLDEVERCDIYLGLFGNDYGYEDGEGVSPTQREFEEATKFHKHRLIFVKGADDSQRTPKMRSLIQKAGNQLIRRRVASTAELIAGLYSALVQYLEDRQLIRNGPFDAAPCRDANLADLDPGLMAQFIRRARLARGLPLPEEATPQELLTHLNLMDRENLTHAAVLLFGKQPQRFLLSSEAKCAHFHGLEVAKPIPSYQVYKGTVFDLVDQAVDFVMSKINLRVGTREGGPEAPVTYEIPREVVTEAIVNAVAHRDYTSAGSVQVMLFADRLEIWNPGLLPFSLTLAKLRQAHGSVPANPLLAEPLYLARYIERMGTGTGDMIRRCQEAGLPEPEFSLSDGFVVTLRRKAQRLPAPGTDEVTDQVTDEVTVEVQRLLLAFQGEMKRADILATLGLRHQPNFRDLYLHPALAGGWVEMTIPEKPNSSKQRYRLTRRGADLQATLRNKNLKP
jgi:hypothetical protein